MTDRWQELRTLFDQLLELQAGEREARLREIAARDPALRARLEAMLGVDDDAADRLRDYEQAAARSILAATSARARGDPLGVIGLLKGQEGTGRPSDEPIGSGATPPEEPAVGRIGQRIGAWRLIEEIGHGGMGVVYLAERADGQFEQRVAVKLLRFGLAMEDLVDRFRTERKILATLQHPHIARLLDGGVIDGGTPWFAMEYVEGEPITEYCNSHGLSVDERLQLFEQVCGVVQHAHNHLVIHRDLKPSNILVTKEGEPRLLDFGLAKVLEDQSGEVSSTRPGRRWLTLEYASPEQVKGAPLTTASDTYQLGLILYEMLTGARPYTVKGLPPSEAERVICDTVPARPSTFVLAAEVEAPVMRLVRREKLSKRLRGDLDTIVLKALHKDSERGINQSF